MTSTSAAAPVRPIEDVPREAGRFADRTRPYLELMRFDRPVGIGLVVLPGWIALALAPGFPPNPVLPVVLALHGALTRGAGCTVNDIADRRLDAGVPRTARRPLADGRISPRNAWIFFAVQLFVALSTPLPFGFDVFALMGVSWLLIVVYPFMKRITHWPHVWLGFTMNWYVLVMWVAVTGTVDTTGLTLYAALVAWAIGTDIVYAHQDRVADVGVGVHSAAVKYGRRTLPLVGALYTATIVGVAAAGVLAGLGPLFWPMLAIAALHLARQVHRLDIDDPASCHRAFVSNVPFACLLVVAVVAGRVA